MRIRKKHFWRIISICMILGITVLFFTFHLSTASSTTTVSIPSTSDPQTTRIDTSPTTLPSDKLDLTLHSQTTTLLQSPAYDTVIDKSADFSSVTIYLDGIHLDITDKPFKYKGRLYLPLRQVGEALDIKIDFNNEKKVALAQSKYYRLEMPLKYTKAVKIPLSTPHSASILSIDYFNPEVSVVFYQEKTYLPVRFTAEALGFAVKYEEKENAVYFTSPKE
ncbi:MAG: copper amine oxidase N-terminal domain-containing protein [Cellulosilyticaceae bacterium]